MKKKAKQYIAVMMAVILAVSGITLANAYGERTARELRVEESAFSKTETVSPSSLEMQTVLPLSGEMQTVSVGAVQASLFVSVTDENATSRATQNTRSTQKYADVTLTLDENPGIFAFAYHLDFDASAWQAVSVTLAPNAAQRGIFMPTLPPLDGSSNAGRLTFLGFIDDWNDPDTTGIIATVRFEGIGTNPDVSSFVLGDLEVVGESMNVSSLAGGSDSPSLHDAARLHRYVASLPGHGISPMCTELDLNNDGKIDLLDLLLISQKFVGYDIASGLCAESLNLFPEDSTPDSSASSRQSASSNSSPRSGSGFVTKPMISGGSFHAVALKSDGTVWAWGENGSGQLGNNSTIRSLVPVKVENLENVIAISTAGHVLALKNDGTVWAWGSNLSGQLGNGTTTRSLIPIQVNNLSDVKAISAGNSHSVALKNDGTILAWGVNWTGQLGDGTYGNISTTPVEVPNFDNVTAIAAGASHTVALRKNGNDNEVWTWGSNWTGQLGVLNIPNDMSLIPVHVQNLDNVTAIMAGGYSTYAIKSDGTAWAWGGNWYAQLADDTLIARNTPTQVLNLNNAVEISSHGYHTLALRGDGHVMSWGENGYGQLGNNDIGDYINTIPDMVHNLDNAVAISTAEGSSYAIKNDGSVWAWGFFGWGQLGVGTTTGCILPTQVVGEGGIGYLNLGSFLENHLDVGGVRVSKTITRVPNSPNLIDVTLSLDENPGIWCLAANLVFDEEKLMPVDITDDNGLNTFVAYLPPEESNWHFNRREFAISRAANTSSETGLIATARFEIIGDITHFPVTIGYLGVSVYDSSPVNNNMSYLSVYTSDDMLSLLEIPIPEMQINAFSVGTNRFFIGDVNGDGRVDVLDVNLIARHIVWHTLTNFNIAAADINGDGNVYVDDLMLLAKWVAGHNVLIDMYMNYGVLVNSAGNSSARLSQAYGILNEVSNNMKSHLKINLVRQYGASDSSLNMRPGCTRGTGDTDFCHNGFCGNDIYGSDCKVNHHRAAGHFINVPSSTMIDTFRFVSYRICDYADGAHYELYGRVTIVNGSDMLTTLSPEHDSEEHKITTAHEIGHLLGAGHCSATNCVMGSITFLPLITNAFCPHCSAAIIRTQRSRQ